MSTTDYRKNPLQKSHLSFEKWGFKISYHTFPPSKGIGEIISVGMITE